MEEATVVSRTPDSKDDLSGSPHAESENLSELSVRGSESDSVMFRQ